ncbi:hypothetical protein QQP08_017961 [Theobroma cacao]|nr:hypothetical protein QQP08_017961 [Theobroma cacao]
MFSRGVKFVHDFISSTLSYSWCVHVTCGGVRQLRRCLSHTGRIEGEIAPFAISAIAEMNWNRPAPSAIVWLSRSAKMIPPHFILLGVINKLIPGSTTMGNLVSRRSRERRIGADPSKEMVAEGLHQIAQV